MIDHARLTTYLGPGEVLQHHFAFQAANWPRPRLLVALPGGARLVAAQADGEILSLLPAWFKLTDASFAALRSRAVPADVLARLDGLKGKELDRSAFVRALADVLEKGERERWQTSVMNHAAMPGRLELPMPERRRPRRRLAPLRSRLRHRRAGLVRVVAGRGGGAAGPAPG